MWKPGWLDTTVWPYRLKKKTADEYLDEAPPEALNKEESQQQRYIQKKKREKEQNEKKRQDLEKKLLRNAAKEEKRKEVQLRQEARIAAGGKPRGRPKKHAAEI